MQLMAFDTMVVPAEKRLAVFRTGAVEFQVDAVGDPAAFTSRWRMLKLGDLNVIHSHTSPVRYRRDAAMIAADGEDRLTIHYYLTGGETGEIDGRPVRVGVGQAMIWDLLLPLDLTANDVVEIIIVTLPRHLIDEVLPGHALAGPLSASPELALAAGHARFLIDHAADMPDETATVLSRSLRDMLAVAILPAYRPSSAMASAKASLLQRLLDLIDTRLSADPDGEALAAALDTDVATVAAVAQPFGGLAVLVERRRLLAAYRLLSDPAQTATVQAIAHRCGFESLPQFSRRFRAVFETSARELRRRGRCRLPEWAGAYDVEQLYGPLIAP